jgi:hypothetical protein
VLDDDDDDDDDDEDAVTAAAAETPVRGVRAWTFEGGMTS